MDRHTLKDTVREAPHSQLLDVLDEDSTQVDFLPLLEVELQRSTARLQRLREYRNSLSSIVYRLPPEVLSHIFFIYAEDNCELYSLLWTRVMLVCKQWYNVAISTPQLWSFVAAGIHFLRPFKHGFLEQDRCNKRRAKTQRARARHHPLSVCINLHFPQAHHLLNFKIMILPTLWEPHLLRSLDVAATIPYMVEILLILARNRHVNLGSLVLNLASVAGAVNEDPRTPSLLNTALATNMPNLQLLRALNIPFDWNVINRLRVLYVRQHDRDAHFFLVSDILDALERSPLLEEFKIQLSPTFNPAIAITRSGVRLSCLMKITICATAGVCIQLLQDLTELPPAACIDVFVRNSPEAPEPQLCLPIASYMGKHAAQNGSPTIRTLAPAVIAASPSANRHFSLFGILHPQRRSSLPTGRYVVLGTNILSVPELGEMASWLRFWPLSNVTHLDLRGLSSVDPLGLETLVTELPALKTLVVHLNVLNIPSLLSIIFSSARKGNDRCLVDNIICDATPQIVPNATSHPTLWASPSGYNFRRTLIRVLWHCAEAARAGFPLETVEIINTHPRIHIIELSDDTDWSELYGNLKKGFVYEGTLYNADVGREGVARDSFASP